MQNLFLIDEYVIKNETEISNTDLKVLTKLYLPIIGKNAFSLYFSLIGESDIFHLFTTNFKISRLALISDLTLEQLKEAFNTLEGIGLIKTYVKYQDFNEYIFEIHRPLSASKFFANSIYHVLLYRKLKKDDYEATKYMFVTQEISSDYEEISARFEDAFFLNNHFFDQQEALNDVRIRENIPLEVEANYPLDLFYQELTHLQIRRDSFSKHNLTAISQLGMIYSIDSMQLAHLVVESMEEGKLNEELLKIKVKNYYSLTPQSKMVGVYRKQPYEYRSSMNSDDPRALKIQQLETLSPYEFIEAKQQSTPQRADLEIVEKCIMEIGLNPGVVNALLDYTWANNDGMLPERYIEKVASSWKRMNIQSVEQAMDVVKKAQKSKKTTNRKTMSTPKKSEAVSSEGDKELLKKLLEQVGE